MIPFLIISNLTLLTGIVISVVFYKKLHPPWLKLLAWFLLITLSISFAGILYSHYTKMSNHFIFNFYILIQFLFYFYLFYKTFEQRNLKLLTQLMAILFVIFYCYNIFFNPGFFVFAAAGNTAGSICIIICCLLYFVSLFQSELNLNFFRIPMFWIATGLLFYFVGNFVYLSLVGYIIRHNLDSGGTIYLYSMATLNFLLYGLLTVGFLSNQLWKNGM